MKRKLFIWVTMLTLVAFSFGAYSAPAYIEALQVGTITGATFTGLVIGTDVQAYDADLTTWAGLTPTANAQTLVESATFLTMTQDLSVEVGVDTQAYNANLTSFATVAPAANMLTFLATADYAAMVTALTLTIGTNTQAWDADLDTWATLTPTANAQTLVESATFLTMTQDLSVEVGVDTQAYDADLDTYATITPSATAQVALASGNNSVVLSHRHRVTVAEINAGHEILPAVTALSYRVINCVAIAYGGAVGTTTTVDVLGTQSAGGVKIAAFAQASLTQSTQLSMLVAAGVTVIADGASWSEMDAATAITVGKTGGDADTATGVDIIITYVIE